MYFVAEPSAQKVRAVRDKIRARFGTAPSDPEPLSDAEVQARSRGERIIHAVDGPAEGCSTTSALPDGKELFIFGTDGLAHFYRIVGADGTGRTVAEYRHGRLRSDTE